MKPILFNTEMVRAILDGRKTVTRRVIKTHIEDSCRYDGHYHEFDNFFKDNPYGFACAKCGYGVHPCTGEPKLLKAKYKKNDILYVRETWSTHYTAESDGELVYCYKADGIDLKAECLPGESNRWYPSIHMPKDAARIFLRVTDVKVKQLQNMNGDDFEKEGIETGITYFKSQINNFGNADRYNEALKTFRNTWNNTIQKNLIDKYGWDANPYVFVYEFEVISKEEVAKESEEQ